MSSQVDNVGEVQHVSSDRSLFSPWVDFLGMGGASLFILPLVLLIPAGYAGMLALLSLFLANFINHPHFAHSYQIFYQDFGKKLAGTDIPSTLRYRYWFSGVLVPVSLACFFVYSLQSHNAALLGLGFNLMALLVGWHYVKQGYGMLMVDSVYKRRFFTNRSKKIFLVNAYCTWIFYWVFANWFLNERKVEFWGVEYGMFDFPVELVILCGASAVLTGTLSVLEFVKAGRTNAGLPINGTVAYFVSLYMWLFMRLQPMAFVLIPVFHSLQYLVVVYRYQLNVTRSQHSVGKERAVVARRHFVRFVLMGFALGLLGFWLLPYVLQRQLTSDQAVFGATVFFFVTWIFINVHHYFMDNVMWRKENPNMKEYLFR